MRQQEGEAEAVGDHGHGQGVQEVQSGIVSEDFSEIHHTVGTGVHVNFPIEKGQIHFFVFKGAVVGSSSASATASGGSTSSPPSPSSPLSSGSAAAAPSVAAVMTMIKVFEDFLEKTQITSSQNRRKILSDRRTVGPCTAFWQNKYTMRKSGPQSYV